MVNVLLELVMFLPHEALTEQDSCVRAYSHFTIGLFIKLVVFYWDFYDVTADSILSSNNTMQVGLD